MAAQHAHRAVVCQRPERIVRVVPGRAQASSIQEGIVNPYYVVSLENFTIPPSPFVTFGARNPGSIPSETSLNVTITANAYHLWKKRSSIRAGVTRALALLSGLLQRLDSDAYQINGHMNFLKDKEAALSRLEDVFLTATDAEDLDHEVEAANKYNKKILYALSRAKFWLQELDPGQTTTHV
ncbi:hypothetical protein HPB51_017892 [Rhipicephalus microplus]|uniref:Uncharacterized protein n=1 Tax=Rhipicephalus microplus TaxID=6941 RepID=A0A9J6F4P6_RHIMP|nr:hypothetical protein HPB51_017892 [Rhipicephalus microplus]